MSTFVLGATLSAFMLAAASASAATLSNVQVLEGTGYTNVTVSATVSGGTGEEVLGVAVMAPGGQQVGNTVYGAAGATSIVIDLGSLSGFVKGKTYNYQVSIKDSSPLVSASATYSNVGWSTNLLFVADATGGDPGVVQGGSWSGTAPTIESNVYKIEGEETVFGLDSAAKNRQDGTHQIVDFKCTVNVDSCYLLEDITNDVTGAIGAMALVTNEAAEVAGPAYWMVLKDGTNWVAATADPSVTTPGNYVVRMEVDRCWGSDKTYVRYSVLNGSSQWITLTNGDKPWFPATNLVEKVSEVCFAGKADVSKFGAKLSTQALVEADGNEYTDISAALTAAGASKKVVLFTNLALSPIGLPSGTYQLDKNNKTITPINVPGKAPNTEGGTIEVGDTTLSVTSGKFVAELSNGAFGTDGNLRFVTLNDATLSPSFTNNVTIYMITNAAASAVIGENATLDLRGWTLTQGSATKPVVTVSGAEKTVTIVGGGSITGAAIAALAATNGAVVVVDDIAITNNAGKAILASASVSPATVIVSNGWFGGSIQADGNIRIWSGYFNNVTFSGSGNTIGYGGRFTQAVGSTPAIADSDYQFVGFGVNPQVGDVIFQSEIAKKIPAAGGGATEPAKVWVITDEGGPTGETVQVPNSFVEAIAPSGSHTAAEQQSELNSHAVYSGVKKWECYVLGMKTDTATEGPYVKSVQTSDPDSIGFKYATAEMTKAVESGAQVQYQVDEYTSPDGTTPARSSERVNYDQNATLTNPSGVRYYKLKVFITPKK